MSHLSDVMNNSALWPCYRDGMVLVTDESGKSIAMNVLGLTTTTILKRNVADNVIEWHYGAIGKYGEVVAWDSTTMRWKDVS